MAVIALSTPLSKVPAERPDAKNAISGASSASATGRRNALRARFAMMRDAHVDSVPVALLSGASRRSPEGVGGGPDGEAVRQMKMAWRLGISTAVPVRLNGPLIVTVNPPPPPRPAPALAAGADVPVLAYPVPAAPGTNPKSAPSLSTRLRPAMAMITV